MTNILRYEKAGIPHFKLSSAPGAAFRIHARISRNFSRVCLGAAVTYSANVAPGFNETPRVTNGYSDLILELYGPDVGMHARSSIGMMIPLNAPVNCEAEVEIDGG